MATILEAGKGRRYLEETVVKVNIDKLGQRLEHRVATRNQREKAVYALLAYAEIVRLYAH